MKACKLLSHSLVPDEESDVQIPFDSMGQWVCVVWLLLRCSRHRIPARQSHPVREMLVSVSRLEAKVLPKHCCRPHRSLDLTILSEARQLLREPAPPYSCPACPVSPDSNPRHSTFIQTPTPLLPEPKALPPDSPRQQEPGQFFFPYRIQTNSCGHSFASWPWGLT